MRRLALTIIEDQALRDLVRGAVHMECEEEDLPALKRVQRERRGFLRVELRQHARTAAKLRRLISNPGEL